MASTLSPLRYPGGKTKIYGRVKKLIEKNGFRDKVYVEPYAGGFGLGMCLLHYGIVRDVVINDADRHIYNFWYSVLYHTEQLNQLILDTPITLDERKRQWDFYRGNNFEDVLRDGFATLFLNRVNYSGVIKAGPIGGYAQKSQYKLDCRFNKEDVIRRINLAAEYRDHIRLECVDAIQLVLNNLWDLRGNVFLNIDPPYVVKGSALYTSYYRKADHIALANVIKEHLHDVPWIVTYDTCDLVREIYHDFFQLEYDINHSAGKSVIGKEIVITNLDEEHFVW